MNAIGWFVGGPYLYICLMLFVGITAWKVYGMKESLKTESSF